MLKSQMWLRHFSQAKLAEQANKAQRPILMTWKIRHFLTSPSLYDEWVECHESPNAPLQLEVLWCFYFRRCLRGAPQSSTWVSCAWLEECVRLLKGCMSCREKEQILWQGGTQGELFRMRAWRGKKPFHFWMNPVFSAHHTGIETAGVPIHPGGNEIGCEQWEVSKSLGEV